MTREQLTKDAQLKKFFEESGFKVLALAHLSACEYGLSLYLLNCVVSGLDQVVTTESELASLMGYDDSVLREAMANLSDRNIIKVRYSDPGKSEHPSLRIGFQFDLKKWILAYGEEKTPGDAIVFPFRRQGTATLKVMNGQKQDKKAKDDITAWERALESYVQGRSLDDEELENAADVAKVLVETHPVDQVLLMVRHFGLRIPTLSLLASSWQHYQEIFEEETQKVDMLGARQKHLELDQKLRENASALLARGESLGLSEEESTVLQILVRHRHPRRQLFWAYQSRSRYPGLEGFFADNVSLMLPVTSGGTVIRKHDS